MHKACAIVHGTVLPRNLWEETDVHFEGGKKNLSANCFIFFLGTLLFAFLQKYYCNDSH